MITSPLIKFFRTHTRADLAPVANSNVVQSVSPVYSKALSESRIAFRKACIYKAFKHLKMDTLLSTPHSSQEIVTKLVLNLDATSRFLYALVSLELITQDKQSGRFYFNQNAPRFSEESSLTLFDLINSGITDVIAVKPKNLEEILVA